MDEGPPPPPEWIAASYENQREPDTFFMLSPAL
jgi:hypothetical protein